MLLPRKVAPLSAIQMMAVTGAIVEGEEGRGEHHPYYRFTIGAGQAVTHDLDPWITRTSKLGYQKNLAYLEKSEKKKLRKKLDKVINAWDGSKSIVNGLLNEFYGVATEDWTDWDFNPDAINLKSAEANYALVRQLLSLQENVKRREDDIPANCYNVDLLTAPRVGEPTTDRIIIGWKALLKAARVLLKAEMKSKHACPAGPGDVTLLQTAVQNTNDAGTLRLRGLNLLSDTMQLSTAPLRVGQNLYTASQVGAKSFNFGYGHVRFILFLEWRIVDDFRAFCG